MLSAIGSSTSSVSGSNSAFNAQIATIENQLQSFQNQLQVYQQQLQSAQNNASSPAGQAQVQQLSSQIATLENQIMQLETQQQALVAQQSQQLQQAAPTAPVNETAAVNSGSGVNTSTNLALPSAITRALAESLSGLSSLPNLNSVQVAALEGQIHVYQKMLLNAQQNSSSTNGPQYIQQITARVFELEGQIAALQGQQAQPTAQTESSAANSPYSTNHLNLPNAEAVSRALAQSQSTNTGIASSATAASPLSATSETTLQTFMKNLFSALGQQQGATPVSASYPHQPGEHHFTEPHLSANIQGLMEQLNSPSQTGSSSSTLNSLNASFQNLLGSLEPTPGQATTATLQTFLFNLSQNLSPGQDISGIVVNTKV